MIRYVIKRLLQIIPVILCVAIVIFMILYFAPGDPINLILGNDYTQEQYDAKAAELGLDRPIFEQLLNFLKNIFLKLDFGTSYVMKNDVRTELFARFPRTATIAVVCCLLQIIIAIPLGIAAATHKDGIVDKLCILLAMIGISIPGFWLGLMMIIVFTLKLNILPSSGIEHWYSYIMPCVANALMGVGGIARLTRSQMLEVINSDYIITARAKGMPEWKILYSHALPNALLPILTHVGLHFGMALGGTVVIESVFSIPGIGYYMMQAVGNRDYPVIRGGVTFLSLLFCLVVLIVDISYAFIDPRIKSQYEGRKKKKSPVKEVAANV